MSGFFIGLALWVAAGRGVARLAGAQHVSLGPLARLCGWLLCGVAADGLVTSILAAVGLPVRVWPLTAPLLMLFAVAGGLPHPGGDHWGTLRSGGLAVLRRDGASLLAAVISVPMVATAAVGRTKLNDEYAIWAFKAKIFLTVGRADPVLLATDPTYRFDHRDYPLLVPSIGVWGQGWFGRQDDRIAHLTLALVVAAGLVLAAGLVRAIAGAAAAVVAIAGIATTSVLVVNATQFIGDATNAVFALCAFCAAALICSSNALEARAASGLLIPLAAGTAMIKSEGGAFTLAALVAALACCPRDRRRLLVAPFVAAVSAVVPWAAWTRAHGLHNDMINGTTLSPSVLVRNGHRFFPILRGFAKYWPGPASAVLVVVVAAVAAHMCLRAPRVRALAFLGLANLLALIALAFTYLVAPEEGDGFFRTNMARVLLLPSAATWTIGAVAAALVWQRTTHPRELAGEPALEADAGHRQRSDAHPSGGA